MFTEVHSDGRIVERETFREVVYTREKVGIEFEDCRRLVEGQRSIPEKPRKWTLRTDLPSVP